MEKDVVCLIFGENMWVLTHSPVGEVRQTPSRELQYTLHVEYTISVVITETQCPYFS